MNLSQLYYFRKLAEVKHYTHAAEELFISQPTLSNSISQLERELGIPLFEREGRKIKLTKYGEEFYQYATEAVNALEKGIALAPRARRVANRKHRHWGDLHHPERLPPVAYQRLSRPIRRRPGQRFPRPHATSVGGPREQSLRTRLHGLRRQQARSHLCARAYPAACGGRAPLRQARMVEESHARFSARARHHHLPAHHADWRRGFRAHGNTRAERNACIRE